MFTFCAHIHYTFTSIAPRIKDNLIGDINSSEQKNSYRRLYDWSIPELKWSEPSCNGKNSYIYAYVRCLTINGKQVQLWVWVKWKNLSTKRSLWAKYSWRNITFLAEGQESKWMTALSLEVPSLVRQRTLSSQRKPQLKGLEIQISKKVLWIFAESSIVVWIY